ncbi:MAG: adhesin [Myxococcaceae bacterium]|nr:adhesin [Myxococcaceae bacterium]
MNRRLQWSVALVLMAFSVTASAQTTGLGFKMMNTRDNPFRYYLDARRPTPAGITLAQVENVTKAAFQTWEDVGCAYPDFQYMGQIATSDTLKAANIGDQYDGFNVSTIWVTEATDPYYATALDNGNFKSGTARVAFGGFLYRCDIFINAVDFKWTTLPTTNPAEEFLDVQTAITHEIGHCLGFADNQVPLESVMNPDFPVGSNRRTLAAEDVQLVCDTYPENGAVGSPCSVSDPCTNGLSCIPFTAPNGSVLYRYCSKSCPNVTTGECPSPFTCESSNLISGATHACLAVPDTYVTQVGKACNPSEPNVLQVCGSGFAVCQGPIPGMPSGATNWPDGYCQETCLAGEPAYSKTCPAGSICANTARDPQDPQDPDPNKDVLANDRCLKSCNPGGNDCRPGYSCAPLAEGNACVPSCYSNADCGQGFSCRLCDRVCLPSTPSGRSVGDPCTNTAQCGTGQACLFFNNAAQGVCTQGCGTGGCDCPSGTACKTVGQATVCMKDCAQGTCAFPLQCNPVGETFSCVPACSTNADCQAGFQCTVNGCVDPSQVPDGGCTLCGDAGTPPPPPPDGGPGGGGGNGGPEGCGCSGAPASALAFFGALALLLIAGGRRSWLRR